MQKSHKEGATNKKDSQMAFNYLYRLLLLKRHVKTCRFGAPSPSLSLRDQRGMHKNLASLDFCTPCRRVAALQKSHKEGVSNKKDSQITFNYLYRLLLLKRHVKTCRFSAPSPSLSLRDQRGMHKNLASLDFCTPCRRDLAFGIIP